MKIVRNDIHKARIITRENIHIPSYNELQTRNRRHVFTRHRIADIVKLSPPLEGMDDLIVGSACSTIFSPTPLLTYLYCRVGSIGVENGPFWRTLLVEDGRTFREMLDCRVCFDRWPGDEGDGEKGRTR